MTLYAKLKDTYALRGWKGLPCGLLNSRNGRTHFLSPDAYTLLELLDGEIDLDQVLLSGEQQKLLERAFKQNIAEKLEHPQPLRDRQRYRKSRGAYIQSLHWSITGGCNLKCKHCYMGAPRRKYRDLDTEQCLGIIAQMEDANVGSVTLTGGEPLTRKDFWLLADALAAAEIPIRQLYTNGLLLDDRFFENMQKRDLHFEFVLSFDCLGRHDWIRGIEGTEEKTIAVIRRLRASGYAVTIGTVLHCGNIGQLLPTYELMKELGVTRWKISDVSDAGEWSTAYHEQLSREALYEAYTELAGLYINDGQPLDIQLGGFFAGSKGDEGGKRSVPFVRHCADAEGLEQHSCLFCRLHPYILPDGRLLPCPLLTGTFMEAGMPNLCDTSLADIYSQPEDRFFKLVSIRSSEVIARNEACTSCEHRFECGGGCRAAAISGGNGIYGIDPDICRYFKDGYRVRVKELGGN